MSLQDQIIARQATKEALRKAEEVFGVSLPHVDIIFSNRMNRSAGSYSWKNDGSEHKLTFSASILNMNDTAKFCADTVIHEVAHFVDKVVNGSTGHNARFYNIMRRLGNTNPTRTHSFQTVKKKGHPYQCQGCGKTMELGTTRHNKVMRGQTNYTHPACGGGRLKYVG